VNDIVYMFPGQTSRYPEMIQKITATHTGAAAIVERASRIVGRDLAAHYRAGNRDVFATNRDVQVGVFLANHLHLYLLEAAGIHAQWSLGMSLGEYNHLVHVGALAFEDALSLIDARGKLFDEAIGGMMVSVFPIDSVAVQSAIARLGLGDRVAIGLYHSPRQQVVSGQRAAVERLVVALESDMFVEAIEIEPRIPMHSPQFERYGERLRPLLDAIHVAAPRMPYVTNALGTVIDGATTDHVRGCLVDQTFMPVRWCDCVEAIAARVGDPYFVEVGPRGVLYHLFGRGWMPGRRARTDVAEGWPTHLRTVVDVLRAS
jgi:[acyl-carrier-protein] S-malonyltransferase